MKFKYQAIKKNGGSQAGTIEASTREKAAELLQKYDLVVVSVEGTNEPFSLSSISGRFHRKVGIKKIVMFSKELSVLISSGVSLIEALKIQSEQEDNKYFREQITTMVDMVEDGDSFSKALGRFPDTFSDFYINIVKSGEVSGKMQESLLHLAEYVEKSYMLSARIKNAMIYPFVILLAFAAIGICMMIFVVPQLVSVFQQNQADLPFVTKIVIFISDFLIKYFYVFIALVVLAVIAGRKYFKTPSGKRNLDNFVLAVPPFNDLFKKFYLARFAENFSMLVGNGVNIISALKISGDAAGNEIYKEVIYRSMEDVKVGGSVAHAFEQSSVVPVMVSKMLKIGEKTGKVDSVLKDVANFYTKEVDIAVEGLTAVIEPILILILGAGVGVLVAAIIMPIYQMTEFY